MFAHAADPSTRLLCSPAQDDKLTGLVARARHHVSSDSSNIRPFFGDRGGGNISAI
jgi:hypothetical protein